MYRSLSIDIAGNKRKDCSIKILSRKIKRTIINVKVAVVCSLNDRRDAQTTHSIFCLLFSSFLFLSTYLASHSLNYFPLVFTAYFILLLFFFISRLLFLLFTQMIHTISSIYIFSFLSSFLFLDTQITCQSLDYFPLLYTIYLISLLSSLHLLVILLIHRFK